MVESAFLSRLGDLRAYRLAVSGRRGLQTRRTKHASNSSCRLPVHCWDGYGTIKLFLRTASAALHSAHDGAFIALINNSVRGTSQGIRIAQPQLLQKYASTLLVAFFRFPSTALTAWCQFFTLS